MDNQEIILNTGKTNLGKIIRKGNTIRRPINENSDFVQELLCYLETMNFDASPRFLGIDEQKREIISYIQGDVPSNLIYYSDAELILAAKLIRRFHDITAGCKLAGTEEIVCHNDLSPCNFVFINNNPIAIIDFEMAAPGKCIFDLAYAAWLWLDIGNIQITPNEQKRRLFLFAIAYGFSDINLLIEVMLQRQNILMEAAIKRNKSCMQKWIQSSLDWTNKYLK
jgi:serine/threonine protein kinase